MFMAMGASAMQYDNPQCLAAFVQAKQGTSDGVHQAESEFAADSTSPELSDMQEDPILLGTDGAL
jgi:hypothetical protein